jgi:two-component system, NarL family, response regulator NreC
MDKLRIVLAEDHNTVREGIKLLINAQKDMEVVGEAENGNEVIKKVEKLAPDVIVMDISMPELNGLKATKRLKKLNPNVKVLTLTRHTDNAYLQQLLSAGVSGYVLKQSAPAELVRAIRTVFSGKNYLDPALTNKVFKDYVGGAPSLRGEGKSGLTDRESDILRLIALGYTNREIGEQMQISVKTVEAHKANAMRKMGMKTRVDIVRYAVLQGWLKVE